MKLELWEIHRFSDVLLWLRIDILHLANSLGVDLYLSATGGQYILSAHAGHDSSSYSVVEVNHNRNSGCIVLLHSSLYCVYDLSSRY